MGKMEEDEKEDGYRLEMFEYFEVNCYITIISKCFNTVKKLIKGKERYFFLGSSRKYN